MRPALLAGLAGCMAVIVTAATGCSAPDQDTFTAAPETATVARSERELSKPSVAADSSGRDVYVAWTEFVDDFHADSYLAASHDGGKTFPIRHRLGAGQGDYEDAPVLEVDERGTLFVSWTHLELDLLIDPSDPYTNAAWQMVARSDDRGSSLSEPVVVPGREKSAGYFMEMAVSPRGDDITLSWFDFTPTYHRKDPSDLREGAPLEVATSHDGGRSFGRPDRVDAQVCICCQPAGYVVDGHPGFVLRGLEPVNLRNPISVVSTDEGDSWRPSATIRDEDFHLPVCPHVGFGADVDGDGVLHAAWWTGGPGVEGVWYSTSQDGVEFSDPVEIEKLTVAPHDHGVSLATDGNGNSWIATVDPGEQGQSQARTMLEVWAVPPGGSPTPLPAGEVPGELPRLAGFQDGAYLVWVEDSQLRLRKLEASS